jgi:inward rectifier potassium channel
MPDGPVDTDELEQLVAARPPRPERRRRRRWLPEARANLSLGSYTVTKRGVARYDWADPYRIAVSLSWPQFLAAIFGIYISVTSAFALAYALVPGAVANARPRVFADHFFFSIETLATVGYGEMYPASLYGHVIATFEILTGVVFTAILTGLIFVRFSKPRAKFLFADHPVVTRHNGQRTLMVRVGNGRAVVLSDAQARLSVLIAERSAEGAQFRRTHQLALVREKIPVFPLTWTLMHVIDEQSPLYGMTPSRAAETDVRLFLVLEARDPDLASIVHDLRNYEPAAVRFNMHYVDVIEDDENGRPCADMTRLSDLEPDAA